MEKFFFVTFHFWFFCFSNNAGAAAEAVDSFGEAFKEPTHL